MSAQLGDWGPWIGIDPKTKERTFYAEPEWYRVGDRERAVVFQPGYRTDRKTFGRHGMEIKWLLRGPRGVTQFLMFTGWDVEVDRFRQGRAPSGADLGYHAPVPQYEGHADYGTQECPYLPGGSCYYDGSGLAADDLLARFLIEGESVIWATLAARHDRLIAAASSEEGAVVDRDRSASADGERQ